MERIWGYTQKNRQTNESHNDDEQNAKCYDLLRRAGGSGRRRIAIRVTTERNKRLGFIVRIFVLLAWNTALARATASQLDRDKRRRRRTEGLRPANECVHRAGE